MDVRWGGGGGGEWEKKMGTKKKKNKVSLYQFVIDSIEIHTWPLCMSFLLKKYWNKWLGGG